MISLQVFKISFLSIALVVLAPIHLRAETCAQLVGVKGKGIEVLRLQSGREGERVRYAMKVDEGKVLPLECDDVVVAPRDASAKILMANGKLSLAPETRIEIASHSRGADAASPNKINLINLAYGKMRALIQKPAKANEKGSKDKPAKTDEPQANFKVRTFSAVAGVRGTDFFASYDPNSGLTEQATLEGNVEVQQAGTAQKVVVGAGQQVAVETTPAAVQAALERKEKQDSTGKDEVSEPPKLAPDAASPVQPLKVETIRDSLRNEIRVTSVAVRDDGDFSHSKAVQVLGKPDSWTFEREKAPEKHDRLKNEF